MKINKEIWIVIRKNGLIILINFLLLFILALSGPFSLYAQSVFINQIHNMVGKGFIIAQFIYPTVLLFVSLMIPVLNKAANLVALRYTYLFDIVWNGRVNEIVRLIPYHRYESEETYDKIKQLSENNVYLSVVSCVFSIFTFIVSTMAYMYILVKVSVWLTISILLLAPAIGYLSSYIADKEYKRSYEMNPDFRYGIYKSSLMRSRDYAKDIRLNRVADYVIRDWENTQKAIDSKVLKNRFKYGLLSTLIRKIEYVVILINLIIIFFSYINGEISVGIFISASNQIFSMRILSKFQTIVTQITTISLTKKIYLEVIKLMQTELTCKKKINTKSTILIEFKDVSFKYPQQEEFILKDINIQFNSGESIAIVGVNGAGKSTLIKLLLGLYKPNKGKILINGIDVNELSLDEKSEIFGVAFQDFGRFCLTLKENIILGKEEEDFAQKVQYIFSDNFSDSLNNGYNTLLGKSFGGAVDVSGGQWQEIAIARALVGTNHVLIFDEPTAALDPVREVEMFEKIDFITKDKLSIFITHRLGFTTKVDRIILIGGNRILEEGSFEELMSQNGSFKKMFEMQKKLYNKGNGS